VDEGSEKEGKFPKLSALGATATVLALLFVGLIAWAWFAGTPEVEPPAVMGMVGTNSGVVVALPAAVPPPTSAESHVTPTTEAAQPVAPSAAENGGTTAPPTPEQANAPAPAPPTAPVTEQTAVAPVAATPPAPTPPAPDASPPADAAPPAASSPATSLSAAVQSNAKPPEPFEEIALVPAPVPDLTEQTRAGLLPRVASDGREPWQVYARPFDRRDAHPRVAIVIGNLGISSAATEAAIGQLPGGVTLAFSPYATRLDQYVPLARGAGHEVLLGAPMEPVSYPANDPGPQALLTTLSPAENLQRLTWQLSRFTGYVGVTNYMGSRFTASERDIRPILEELHKRGLLFFDSHSAGSSVAGRIAAQIGMPTASNERFIDTEPSRAAISQALAAVEEEAKQKGSAIAMGFPYNVTIERVAAWTKTLADAGIALAPVSAMVSDDKKAN